MKLLRIDSSARASSLSRQLTSQFVDAWRSRHAAAQVVQRDLANTIPPPITDDWSATYRDPSLISAAERQYLSDHVVRLGQTVVLDNRGSRGLLHGPASRGRDVPRRIVFSQVAPRCSQFPRAVSARDSSRDRADEHHLCPRRTPGQPRARRGVARSRARATEAACRSTVREAP